MIATTLRKARLALPQYHSLIAFITHTQFPRFRSTACNVQLIGALFRGRFGSKITSNLQEERIFEAGKVQDARTSSYSVEGTGETINRHPELTRHNHEEFNKTKAEKHEKADISHEPEIIDNSKDESTLLDTYGYYRGLADSAVAPSHNVHDTHIPGLLSATPLEINASAPRLGSLVEVRTNGRVHFGVVTKQSRGRFQESHTALEVFAAEGEFISVQPSDVTLHLPGYFNRELILASDIYEEQNLLENIQLHLIEMVRSALALRKTAYHSIFKSLHSHLSRDYAINTFKLGDTVSLISRNGVSFSAFPLPQQAVTLLACHLEFSCVPKDWMVLGGYGGTRLVPSCTYAATSIYSQSVLSSVLLRLNEADIESFRYTLAAFLAKKPSPSVLNGHFVYDRPAENRILQLLKHYIVYPHARIEKRVAQILAGITEPSPSSVYRLLMAIGVYSTTTDPYLSAGFYGKVQKSKLEASNFASIEDTSDADSFQSNFSTLDSMYFARTVLAETPVYAIPSRSLAALATPGLSELAFSVDHIDKHTSVIHFHIPDVVTKLSPHLPLYQCLRQKLPPFAEKTLDYKDTSKAFFPRNLLPIATFKESAEPITCFTVSMTYRSKSSDLVQTSISFNYLKDIRLLREDELSGVLDFHEKHHPANFMPRKDYSLTRDDEENIGTVRNMLMSHKEQRRRCYAVETSFQAPTVNETPSGDLELVYKGRDMIDLFVNEINVLMGELVGKFGTAKGLPLAYRSQELVDIESQDEKGIEISPRSILYPKYHATAYEHFFLEPNVGGLAPTKYVCATNLLAPEIVSCVPSPEKVHTGLGLKNLYVRIHCPLSDFEAMLNQYQLLSHCIRESYCQTAVKRRHILLRGYDVNALTALELHGVYKSVAAAEMSRAVVRQNMHTYWTLRYLEQELRREADPAQDYTFIFKCVVLQSSSTSPAKAYCMELGIDVDVVVKPGESMTIGDRIICSRVVILNPLAGKLVLM
ncbi:hypothetical protein BABINDRAFT_167545 [Babjeviella inositovora NRRL Y-12698]|uniref:Uncharacterized protein n=1 Tax=Babjeviella inositovora NRRL Y-12698 TaxID=984486 RepID=A0A1E3QMT4_9ASCO|nr:uncharacterized protein BABINDRAFT_167545 [Babjeviella inositovora NRRL Y-12698]ODQ78995.1 hypothetical protein BABINDRAFT_167545 [Babjeviella inositovora NRRL Y-12698]